jgi:hypothetical protein
MFLEPYRIESIFLCNPDLPECFGVVVSPLSRRDAEAENFRFIQPDRRPFET